MPQIPSWTEKEEKRLIDLWVRQKKTAQEISEMFAGKTRSAILGKIHRLGLKQDKISVTTRTLLQKNNPQESQDPVIPLFQSRYDLAPAARRLYSLNDLGPRMCRFCYGTPRSEGFGFCGAQTQGGSWCEDHHKIVFSTARVTAEQIARGCE